ncbi:MAG: hypothetical protein EHM47_17130 [Ignavibacteriales bacterium]|nr:MAG: hypothetical protein EHM47_17130 [Ignavibacteriales bacterium]
MFKKLILLLPFIIQSVLAQDSTYSLDTIRNEYKSFNYVNVINKSVEILITHRNIPSKDLVEIYLLKGSSHFALQEDTLAKYSFLEILKIDSLFTPDTISVSPKIVRFFNEVKSSYLSSRMIVKKAPVDSLKWFNHYNQLYKERVNLFRNSLYRSLVFPGLGHLYAGDSKGWYLTAAGVLSFTSSVYFIIRTNDKKSEYLLAQEPETIEEKYKSYNDSYKFRNISFIVFGAVWLFSQIDIISTVFPEPSNLQIYLSPGEMNFAFSIPF